MILLWNHTGGIPDFVRTLYQNILDRDPESQAAINYWMDYTHSHGIALTIGGFFTSNEFKARGLPIEVVVDKLYRAILGCEAEAEGKNYWLDRFRRGDGMQVIVNDFVGSREYRQKVQDNLVPHPVYWPSYTQNDYDWNFSL